MISFLWPWAFLLLPLPLLTGHLLPPGALEQGALRYPGYARITALRHRTNTSRRRRPPLVPTAIWGLLVCALAQPLWIGEDHPEPISGRDLMMLIDVSGSMRKPDFQHQGEAVDRLTVVKTLAARFVEGRRGDRVGLILFGDKPYLRASPSYDYLAIIELIKEAEIALAGESTAIGDAIGLAIKRMRPLRGSSRVIVLLTDGANNEGRIHPKQSASLAAAEHIKIYTIGVGATDTPSPNPYGIWSSRDAERFEREVLESLAQTTQGRYFHVLDSDGLQQAYAQLDRLEPALGAEAYKYYAQALYPWPLALALLIHLLWNGRYIASLDFRSEKNSG